MKRERHEVSFEVCTFILCIGAANRGSQRGIPFVGVWGSAPLLSF